MTANPLAVGRLAWIDWLKVAVVFGVFLYHAAQPFVPTVWIVNDTEENAVLSGLAGFGYLFGMPLMFLLSGAASWLALGHRSLGAFAGVRVRRLLIPLVVGVAVLSPFQVWIADAIGGSGLGPVEGFGAWYADVKLAPTPEWFGDYGFHLWFIAFLLVYALASIPLLAVLRRTGAERALARLAGLPAGVVAAALLVPLLASQWLLRIPAPGYRDWADFALWLGFFWLGIVLMAERRLLGRALQAGPWLGLLGVVLTLIFIPIALSGALWDLEGSPQLSLATLGYVTLRTAVAVGLVGGCLWIGARWFTAQPGILRWASRAILPFYVIHHPVIVVVAALVVPLGIDLWLKFGLIAALSLAGTLLLTDAAMRTRLGRALFGLARPVAARAAVPLSRPPVLRETS